VNERIRALATEATSLVEQRPGTGICLTDDLLDKFAELLLAEVTDILTTYRMKVIFEDGFEYNCQHPIQAIHKHFGVKS